MLMYYVNFYTFFEELEKDWLTILEKEKSIPPNARFLTKGLTFWKTNPHCLFIGTADMCFVCYSFLVDTNIIKTKSGAT